jgi:hypothetical protein
MSDPRSLLERESRRFVQANGAFERLQHRRDRKRRNQRIGAAVLGLAITVALGWAGINAIRSTPQVPADDRSEEFGIFSPVAGRILFINGGIDVGYDPGLWAVDPDGPSDTVEGPSVADEVASTLVQLDLGDAEPVGWSSDGTELLFTRTPGDLAKVLYVLHADGSETRLNEEPRYNLSAAISPDGSRVAFYSGGPNGTGGIVVVDVESGRSVDLPYPSGGGEPAGAMTFSPDGSQIAYLANDGVWVMDADGTDAHEIVANEATRNAFEWFSGMEWSPRGDRIAIGLGGDPAIYTFAPDGSDFTKVITGGVEPYWSPDGSQIAYTIPCDEYPNDQGPCPVGTPRHSLFDPQPGGSPAGLAIADADGSNVRAFGFAASGPWHRGESVTPSAVRGAIPAGTAPI